MNIKQILLQTLTIRFIMRRVFSKVCVYDFDKTIGERKWITRFRIEERADGFREVF